MRRALPGLESLVLLACLAGAPAVARGAGEPPPGAPAPPPPDASGHGFDVSFGGGALLPEGDMARGTQAGLDVSGRVGWSSRAGLGLVLSVDYAPLRPKPVAGVDDTVDAHLFAGSVAPRLTLGRSLLRVWLAAGAGLLVERTQVQPISGATGTTTVDSGLTVGGQGGLDFLFFDSGGLSLAGGYTHGVASVEKYRYLAFTAGLLFTL